MYAVQRKLATLVLLTGARGKKRSPAPERLPRVRVALGQEVINAVKSSSVETVVGAEGDAEGALVRLDVELLELAAVTRIFAVAAHVIGELDVVARRRRFAPETASELANWMFYVRICECVSKKGFVII
jgi:hypothetical protein